MFTISDFEATRDPGRPTALFPDGCEGWLPSCEFIPRGKPPVMRRR